MLYNHFKNIKDNNDDDFIINEEKSFTNFK